MQINKCNKTHSNNCAPHYEKRWRNIGSTLLKLMTAAGFWLVDTRELPCKQGQIKRDYFRHVLQNESCSESKMNPVMLSASLQAVFILQSYHVLSPLTPSLPQHVKFTAWKMHARTCRQYIFRAYNTSTFNAIFFFPENLFTSRCEKEKGLKVSNLAILLVVFKLHHGSGGVNDIQNVLSSAFRLQFVRFCCFSCLFFFFFLFFMLLISPFLNWFFFL